MMSDNSQIIKEDEIDVIELAKAIWLRRWSIMKITAIFVVLGLLIGFTSPKEYTTSSTLIPEAVGSEAKLGGSLGGLASLAGIDLGGLSGGSGSNINPGLYRSVAQSSPFLLEIMYEKFYFQDLGRKVSLYEYCDSYLKKTLVSKILSLPLKAIGLIKSEENSASKPSVSSNFVEITKDQQKVMEELKDRILVTMDWELNVVTIEVEMQDPKVTAEIAAYTQDYITQYVTNYAISKSEKQLEFVQAQYNKRKVEFESVQLELAQFRDKNQFVNTARARSEEERIQSKYNLAFSIYNQLGQQIESIKLQINENKPVFSVLEPVKVPVEKSKPRKTLILAVFMFVGVFVSVARVFIQYIF